MSKRLSPEQKAEREAAKAAKLAAKPKGPKMPIEDYLRSLSESDEDDEDSDVGDTGEEGKGKIWHILKLYIRGYLRTDIVAVGFNRSTVYRQCGEYDKLRKAPATHYQGFEVFEMRVKRLMSAKKISREDAVKLIYAKDME